MNVVSVPSPGLPGGPCRGSCDHVKCHALRAMADERCNHCGCRLGFGTKITGEPAMHLRCALGVAARNGASAAHPMSNPAAGHRHVQHHGGKQ